MATRNLEDMKNRLYEAFDKALDSSRFSSAGYSEKDAQISAAYLAAASEAAKAIVIIEREQRQAKERGFGRLDKQ